MADADAVDLENKAASTKAAGSAEAGSGEEAGLDAVDSIAVALVKVDLADGVASIAAVSAKADSVAVGASTAVASAAGVVLADVAAIQPIFFGKWISTAMGCSISPKCRAVRGL